MGGTKSRGFFWVYKYNIFLKHSLNDTLMTDAIHHYTYLTIPPI